MSKIDLYKGEALAVMDELIEQGVVVDAIITDPPYGATACKWDSVIPFPEMWERLNKLIKPNGAIVLFGSEPFSSALRISNIKNYKYDWKWEKTKGANVMQAKICPLKNYEDIIVFSDGTLCATSKNKVVYFPQGLKETNRKYKSVMNKNGVHGNRKTKEQNLKHTNYPNSIIHFNGSMDRLHPTQKPEKLMEYLISTYTNKNELVLDFTMGSGSTIIGCLNTNRRGIGIELDDKYFGIARRRLRRAKVEKGLFDE